MTSFDDAIASQPASELARLLSVSMELDDVDPRHQARMERLSALLDQSVDAFLGKEPVESSDDVLLSRAAGLDDAPTLRQVLFDMHPSIEQLNRIKQAAKKLAHNDDDHATRSVGTAIYYAAIARAAVLHRSRITTHEDDKLRGGLRDLCDKAWIDTELADLYQQAIDRIDSSSR